MKPTIGRIVLYRVAPQDEKELRFNHAEILPAIIVTVFAEEHVNLQVFCDGPATTFWKTSVLCGDKPGQWNWPAIVAPPVGEGITLASVSPTADALRQRARQFKDAPPEASPEIGILAALDELVLAAYEQAAQFAELIEALKEKAKKK